MLATGGDDCTVRLWLAQARSALPNEDLARVHTSLQTLLLPGKVWALALHSQLLVVGGALEGDGGPETDDADGPSGHIRVRLFGVADLANGSGLAVVLRTLQVPSIGTHWGVRSVATRGGTVIVVGGDDGVVHVWTLAEKGKADQLDSPESEPGENRMAYSCRPQGQAASSAGTCD